MKPANRSRLVRSLGSVVVLGTALAMLAQCRATRVHASPEAKAAWGVVYDVLQHPRCLNCHPAGDAPLFGDDSRPHAQNVQRGADGTGRSAMRCFTCHQRENAPGEHLPPGAPGWQLPHPAMPLVFEGRTLGELCRQMRDPAQNGNRTLEQLLRHAEEDPLVLWGWAPGAGRTPVPIAHAAFVAAVRKWIDEGCGCPE